MIPTTNGGNPNPSGSAAAEILAFKPRQVLLLLAAQQITNPKPTMPNNNNKTLSLIKPEHKTTTLLHSILHYLHLNGFSKTLKRFLSEAQIQDDNWKASSLDLEDMYSKYLETCSHAVTTLKTHRDQERKTRGNTQKDGESDRAASEGAINNKKETKNTSEENDQNVVSANSGADDTFTKSVINSKQLLEQNSEASKEPTGNIVCEVEMDESTKIRKDKKKKRSKLISASLDDNIENGEMNLLLEATQKTSEDIIPLEGSVRIDSEAQVRSKDKKKKNKPISNSVFANGEQCGLEEENGLAPDKHVSDSALGNTHDEPLEVKKIDSKDKRRKKQVSVTEKVVEKLDNENSHRTDSEKEYFQTSKAATNNDEKNTKKRKILVSGENKHQPGENVGTEKSKRRKIEGLEEAKSTEQLKKFDVFPGGDGHDYRESKGSNGQVNSSESLKTSIKQDDQEANGNFQKSGVEKSARKQHNNSTEPKTVNAFQRVKVDEVNFADEKLQDNSYWAKDGAEVGYGAKAQEILGQVRGRDFRHEKTKKKRGSYRGGQIDLQSRSVKFNYDD